ncbi:hypothetical protein ACLOJK_022234 [Asimina triloba]
MIIPFTLHMIFQAIRSGTIGLLYRIKREVGVKFPMSFQFVNALDFQRYSIVFVVIKPSISNPSASVIPFLHRQIGCLSGARSIFLRKQIQRRCPISNRRLLLSSPHFFRERLQMLDIAHSILHSNQGFALIPEEAGDDWQHLVGQSCVRTTAVAEEDGASDDRTMSSLTFAICRGWEKRRAQIRK